MLMHDKLITLAPGIRPWLCHYNMARGAMLHISILLRSANASIDSPAIGCMSVLLLSSPMGFQTTMMSGCHLFSVEELSQKGQWQA